MSRYYTDKLSGVRLRRVYEVAPPEARNYLEAEIDFVRARSKPGERLLELGCGYGRVLARLDGVDAWGIDTSQESLAMAQELLPASCRLICMDAGRMAFAEHAFDIVICIQNGISAFGIDQLTLVREAVRVARPGGRVLVSSYSERFWGPRLDWFMVQAEHGLIGEIDMKATGKGIIVCKDGFRATTTDAEGFRRLAAGVGIEPKLVEVAGSSLFCELHVP